MEHTLDLLRKAHEGDKAARDTLVEENMGLVWSIVRRFTGRGVEALFLGFGSGRLNHIWKNGEYLIVRMKQIWKRTIPGTESGTESFRIWRRKSTGRRSVIWRI